jgi:hypothetical protein
MFSRFTRHNGEHTVFIRSEHLISMSDTDEGGCLLSWNGGETTAHLTIDGTATENMERLKAEELAAIDEANRHHQRAEAGLPIVPVRRGRL